MELKLSIVCLLCVAAVAMCANGASTSEAEVAGTQNAPAEPVRSGFSPAKLFDFTNFKTIFHKSYSGFLEEMVRAKHYLSRAFRAFISAIKYKHHQSHYYLAVNEMSDWTRDEINKSKNKVLEDKASKEAHATDKSDKMNDSNENEDELDNDLPDTLPENVEQLEEELKKMADAVEPGEPGYIELKRATGQRVRLGAFEGFNEKIRELPMEKLIDTGAEGQLTAKAASKLTESVPTNNPQYEAPKLAAAFGLRHEQKKVRYWPINRAVVSTMSEPDADSDASRELEDDAQKPVDEVFVDLRESGCFTVPRQQGPCGSCWTFASTAIFEYLHCMKTGKLVPFSEQYMLDCATEYVEHAHGCQGGDDEAAANFVRNFGLELRLNYPYNARVNQCPYEESTEIKRTGYIRFNFYNAVGIGIDLWPEYIKHGPLFIGISMSPSFAEYGGGVFGWGCDQEKPNHSVVLVGHGRQDGQEYWLIRNSHSATWGEGGYGKLAKSARCTGEKIGYTFATNDGRLFTPFIKDNPHNDPTLVANHKERLSQLDAPLID